MFKSIPQLNIIIKKQVKPNVLGLHHCGINKCVVLFLFCCRQPKAAFRAPEEVCSASLITCGAASGAEHRCAQRNAAPHWSRAELQPGQSRSAEQSRCWSAALTGGQNWNCVVEPTSSLLWDMYLKDSPHPFSAQDIGKIISQYCCNFKYRRHLVTQFQFVLYVCVCLTCWAFLKALSNAILFHTFNPDRLYPRVIFHLSALNSFAIWRVDRLKGRLTRSCTPCQSSTTSSHTAQSASAKVAGHTDTDLDFYQML